jgi:hypothetical protein
MGWGKWSRWGRGSCEGYGLHIGHLLRFGVTANAERNSWSVSLNDAYLRGPTDKAKPGADLP